VIISIEELRALVKKIIVGYGLSEADAEYVTSDLIDAEISGKKTHGIGKAVLIKDAMAQREGSPLVSGYLGAITQVNGQRELGQLAARYCVGLVIDQANENGIGIATLRNAARFGRLAPYVEAIAEQGMIGILVTTGGPSAIVPVGSKDPVVGINPVAFGFPKGDRPYILDFGSAERVWGEIRQAILEHRELPVGAFVDSDGKETHDPAHVNGVLPAGGYRGLALAIAIELLVASLCALPVGTQVNDEYQCGSVFIAINGLDNGALPGIERKVSDLIAQIEDSRPMDGIDTVRAPGTVANAVADRNRAQGTVDVNDGVLRILKDIAEGRDTGLGASGAIN
jgi:L-2-hydroxycarboxylate dehydrogenase (NAD+)